MKNMASSGTINNTFRTGYAIRIVWNVNSQSASGNTSNITAKVQLISLGSSYIINSSASKSGSLTINGTKYTFDFTAALSGNQTKTLFTKTVDVAHNADGTKTCAFSCVAGIDVTLSGKYWGDVTASGNGTFNTIPRASSISSVTSSVAINGTNEVTVAISRATSAFTHTVVFKFGSYSKTTTGVGTSTSYAIPTSWMNAIPNATSGTATVQVTTYSGSTKIGSTVSKTFKVTVPSTVVPSISSVSISEAEAGINAQFGGYVQNKSKLKVTVSAAGAYSSTIKSYKTTILGKNYTTASFTSGFLTSSGTVAVAVTITDSRGRTATTTKNVTVIAYKSPTINSFSGVRCLADGTEDNNGTYLKASVNFAISAVNNKNTKAYTIEYKLPSASTWTTLTSGSVYALNSNLISASGAFDVNNTYDVRLSITDFFGTVRKIIELSTAFTLIDFNASGRGIAFGKVSEETEGIEFALPVISTLGHFISSPVLLTDNADLNTIIEPGYYVVGNTTISATIKNKPPTTTTETALVEVYPMGNGLQRVQRYSMCDKDDQYIFQRIYYSTTWGEWMLIAGCSGWKNLTLDSAFNSYSDNTPPRYRVNGNLVTVMGAVSPKTAYTSSTEKVVIASGIPAYFRPTTPLAFICQGSGLNRWTCGIETNGSVTISRYGITENVSVPTTAWLIFNVTYSI